MLSEADECFECDACCDANECFYPDECCYELGVIGYERIRALSFVRLPTVYRKQPSWLFSVDSRLFAFNSDDDSNSIAEEDHPQRHVPFSFNSPFFYLHLFSSG